MVAAGASAPSAPRRRCCHGIECVQGHVYTGGAWLSAYNAGPDCHACAAAGKPAPRPNLGGPGPEVVGEVYVECDGCGRMRLVPDSAGITTFHALEAWRSKYPRCQSCAMELRHARSVSDDGGVA